MSLKRIVVMVSMLAAATGAFAAVGDGDQPDISLMPFGGYTLWTDEIGLDDGISYGGRGAVFFFPWLSLEGGLTWIDTGPGDTFRFVPTTRNSDDVTARLASLDLVLDLRPHSTLNPFLLAGWAQYDVSGDALDHDWHLNGWEAGGGLKIRLGGSNANYTALRLEARDVLNDLASSFGNDGDLTHNLLLSAGLQFHFGYASRDADGDGVRDRADRCPDTPAGAFVDAAGCPSDGDGDGVPDGLDRCPDTDPGLPVDETGCPVDADGDGVPDGVDRCSDTPAGASVGPDGCPTDGDGDGVLDGLDACADTPAGAEVDARGCPVDSDGDGVYDGIDRCPDTPSNLLVGSDGCPITVTETDTQLLDTGMIRTSDVRFRSGSSTLETGDTAKLDEIGRTLAHWPELHMEIGGYTDSSGSEDANQRLSEARAQAVLDYLTAKFPAIDPAQYTVRGYGEADPIADNTTAAGRAMNRRVEFKVLNRDEIKKVIQRQKTLER